MGYKYLEGNKLRNLVSSIFKEESPQCISRCPTGMCQCHRLKGHDGVHVSLLEIWGEPSANDFDLLERSQGT